MVRNQYYGMAVVRLLDCKQIVIALGGAQVSLSLAKILYAYDYGIAIGWQSAIAPAHYGYG
jgi:spore coat polysaccharide biosynthesis predicted glycosyltransferase SpsG